MIVLASASPARAQILKSAGIAFMVAPAKIDETSLKGELLGRGLSVMAVAQALADAKASAVSAGRNEIIIGADQTLELEGALVDKVCNPIEAREILRRMRGRTHRLHSAVSLARAGRVFWRHTSSPRLRMRRFSESFLDGYLAQLGADVVGSLGGYHLEGVGAQLFERVTGDYFAVLGLPLIPLLTALRREGVLQD